MPTLFLDWCSQKAARFACDRWHYTKTMPVARAGCVGVWEDSTFIGAVVFARGMCPSLGDRFGLRPHETIELCRVALNKHHAPVSKVVSIACRIVLKKNEGIKCIVSFADPAQGHVGTIYQAMGWIYTGTSDPSYEWRLNGARLNKRRFVGRNFGAPKESPPEGAVRVDLPGKHRYAKPFCGLVVDRLSSMMAPYPKKKCAKSIGSDAASFQEAEGGAIPTLALHRQP